MSQKAHNGKSLSQTLSDNYKLLQNIKFITAAAVILAAAVFSILFKAQIHEWFSAVGLESIYTAAEDYPLSIYFPDCGSAGCALIKTDGGTVLIDCGHEKAQTNVLDILHYLGEEQIDLAVLTHPERDHIGNFSEVIEKLDVRRFITCPFAETSDSRLYHELTEACTIHGINIEYVSAGDRFSFGKLSVEIISPDKIYSSVNDNSVAAMVRYGDFSALFTGDISKRAEKSILESGKDIRADLICVPHHGSGSSSSNEFLDAVCAKYAVISVEESDYQPNGSTIKRLSDHSCRIYRTDLSGTIAVFSCGIKDDVVVMPEIG